MLNNAWPSMIWHLYDWYLMPGGGYFGTKKANEPVHVQYSADDGSVAVVNSLYQSFPKMKVRAQVLNLDMTSKFDKEATLDVSQNSSTRAITIPQIEGLSPTYFVRLWLSDSSGKNVSDNFYWLSTKPVVFDWEHGDWYYTPTTQLEDFTPLKNLAEVTLKGSATTEHQGRRTVVHVSLENPGRTLAFQTHLRVTDSRGEDVLPVIFEDNYFPLFPGERRLVSVTFDSDKLAGAASVFVEGWNVKSARLPMKAGAAKATNGGSQKASPGPPLATTPSKSGL